jgi:hypothetical protein
VHFSSVHFFWTIPLVTQGMVDDALDIWQRLADAGSPELADASNAELAKYNDLQDFVGLTFNEWSQGIGVRRRACWVSAGGG